ncbi:MAG: DUF1697 domain-containing protein [Eubacterium sp.]
MQRYLSLLRGINVSGKNKITMSELKSGFAEWGFINAVTYLNSGNVTFSSDNDNKADVSGKIQEMIKSKFNLDIPVFVMAFEELEDILNNAPDWWGDDNKDIYDNLIFVMPPVTYEEVFKVIGEPKKEYEKISSYKNAIFWSFIRKDYTKTNWWAKTASSSISDKITIRTANTVRKIQSKVTCK